MLKTQLAKSKINERYWYVVGRFFTFAVVGLVVLGVWIYFSRMMDEGQRLAGYLVDQHGQDKQECDERIARINHDRYLGKENNHGD